jgi:glucose-6-phosphate isomerase
VQQLRDGVDNFFVTFIEVLEDPIDVPAVHGENPADFLDGFLQGTRTALMESGRQSLSITLRQLNARTLGALIALFERAVGFYGELVNLNAYHQPGVEAGKKAAAGILDLQQRLEGVLADGQTRSLADLQKQLELPSPEPVFWILRHLCANPRGYRAEGHWGDPASLRVAKA